MGREDVLPLCGDLTNLDLVSCTLRRLHPDVIVNAAAYTSVDLAESEPVFARAINALGPGRLAHEAATLGALLIHYSTDCVFDGSGTKPWAESSATRPINVYGQTKLEGEELIRASGCFHLIIRTSWIHAARGDSFARLMLRLASERDSLDVVNDQFGAPTGAALVADATAHALRATVQMPELRGTYHCVASGFVSRHEYAMFVISEAITAGLPLRLTPGAIRPVTSDAFRSPARRPLNARLASGKFCDAFDFNLPDWRIGLRHTLCELFEGQAILRH